MNDRERKDLDAPSPISAGSEAVGIGAGLEDSAILAGETGRRHGMHGVNLRQKLDMVTEPWVPRIIGELNGQLVKIARFEGEFVWHAHATEDELFLVVEGRIEIHLRDRVVALEAGEFFIVPRGVEHKPVAHGSAGVLLFEPATVRNTGDVDHDHTIDPDDLERI